MGSQRRDSEQRRAVRLTLGTEDRPTLLPCPACGGQAQHTTETAKGRYRTRPCKWCSGSGLVDAFVQRLFIRWLRIRNANRHCLRP